MSVSFSLSRSPARSDIAPASINSNLMRPVARHHVAEEEEDEVAVITHLKLPPFWKNDPELWFIQVDAQFHPKGIRRDHSKYYHLLTALDVEALQQVSDIVRSPPDQGKYDNLKINLINRFTESKERQLHRLLTDLELGDKKSTQFLREMKTLAAGTVPDDLLRSLWMKRMPNNVRCILLASPSLELTVLADLADRIMETNTVSHVMAVNSESAITSVSSIDKSSVNDRFDKIKKQMADILTNFTKLVDIKSQTFTRKFRSRSKSPIRPSSAFTTANSD